RCCRVPGRIRARETRADRCCRVPGRSRTWNRTWDSAPPSLPLQPAGDDRVARVRAGTCDVALLAPAKGVADALVQLAVDPDRLPQAFDDVPGEVADLVDAVFPVVLERLGRPVQPGMPQVGAAGVAQPVGGPGHALLGVLQGVCQMA